MYSALLHAHSGLRWILLLLILATIIGALGNRGGSLSEGTKKLSLFAMISTHLQATLGLVLYFLSPKVQFSANTMGNSMLRFFTMEHVLMMLIALVLITIGHRHSKAGNANKVFWFYLIALLVMLAAIPWPFRQALGGAWF
jgi:hypothetical protein